MAIIRTVVVNAEGPQGAKGDQGPIGPQGPPGDITNVFPFSGSAVITGSLLISGSNLTVLGSATATSFTGSLFGTSSWATNATSASYALTASYALNSTPVDTSALVTTSSFNTFTSSIQSQVNSLTAATSSYITTSQTASMTVLSASFASTASLAPNYLLITSTSSILAPYLLSSLTASFLQSNQSGSFVLTSSFNSFTLSYNTGSFTGSFTGSLSGTSSFSINAKTASYIDPLFISASAASYGFGNNAPETDPIFTAVSASLVYTSSFNAFTSSIQSQVNNLNTATSSFVNANQTGSFTLTSSFNSFTASYTTGSFLGNINGTASWSNNSVLLNYTSSNVFATTGSNIFRGDQTVTGSLFTTGSNTLIGSTTLTGSLNVSGSTTQIGNNSLLGNTTLSGSIIISGSLGTSNPTVRIYGDTTHNGYLRFDPVTTNIDTSISASYIYVSGSTNDLYFSQNGSGYSNVTRLRWLEGNLYTGLLHGGIISSTVGGTTFNISSGSGIVVNLNASLTTDPFPTIKFVNWNNFTNQPITYRTSSIQTYLGIDSSGNIIQQTTPWNDGQYNESISLGTVIHQNQSTVNATITYPNVAYGYKQRTYDFIKAFGPLKLSGYTLSTSSSLGLTVGSGNAFADGRNYQNDPNNPSYITDAGTTVSKIFRYYQSGSSFVQDTNAAAGYTGIDTTQYNPNGTGILTGTSPSKFYVHRIFWYPNSATKGIVDYYGLNEYATLDEAQSKFTNESFLETPNTQQNAIFLGIVIIKGNSNFNNANDYRVVQASLFRAAGLGGGGTGGAGTPGGSNTQIQYNNNGVFDGVPNLTWNGSALSATGSFAGTFAGSLSGTSSWATNAITSSYIDPLFISASAVRYGFGSGGGATTPTGSLLTTASFTSPNITFTKGDSTTFDVNIAPLTSSLVQSSQTSSMTVLSSSFAATASFVSLAQTASYVLQAVNASFATSAQNAITASYISPNNALLSGLSYTVYANTSALTVPSDTNVNTVATITIPSSSIRVGSMIRVNSLSSIGTIVAASFQCLTTQSAFMDTSGFFYDSAIRQSTLYPNIMIKVASATTLRSFPTIRTVFQGPTTTAIITKTIPNITTNDINLYLNVQKGGSAYAFSQEILNVEVIY